MDICEIFWKEQTSSICTYINICLDQQLQQFSVLSDHKVE